LDYLHAGDVLVFNDTKVFKARLHGRIGDKKIEVFLLSPELNSSSLTAAVGEGKGRGWKALLKPGRKAQTGDKIDLGELVAEISEKHNDGTVDLKFSVSKDEVLKFADVHGEIPVPPYVKKVPDQLETYQTIYAREIGSVAAPTAGFHFTKELLEKIKEKGIRVEFVTLHVGLGTFRPVKTETLEEHEMYSELVEIKSEVAKRLNAAKSEGRRIIAVGTTTTRALEGAAAANSGELSENGFFGEVNLFITPGFKFKMINSLITNFHLPKSTLLVLVSALAGRENVLRAYNEAIREGYRFYSFGDAMFVLGDSL
jgi:S-adenosylmethionine:tRNA ribosyltransferase-isomerase